MRMGAETRVPTKVRGWLIQNVVGDLQLSHILRSGTVTVYDLETPEKRRLIELAYEQAEAAGIVQLNEDEAGPYQAIPQPGASWQASSHPADASTRIRTWRNG
jgi:hypothetical protein